MLFICQKSCAAMSTGCSRVTRWDRQSEECSWWSVTSTSYPALNFNSVSVLRETGSSYSRCSLNSALKSLCTAISRQRGRTESSPQVCRARQEVSLSTVDLSSTRRVRRLITKLSLRFRIFFRKFCRSFFLMYFPDFRKPSVNRPTWAEFYRYMVVGCGIQVNLVK